MNERTVLSLLQEANKHMKAAKQAVDEIAIMLGYMRIPEPHEPSIPYPELAPKDLCKCIGKVLLKY